jgi:hypothetical protein
MPPLRKRVGQLVEECQYMPNIGQFEVQTTHAQYKGIVINSSQGVGMMHSPPCLIPHHPLPHPVRGVVGHAIL